MKPKLVIDLFAGGGGASLGIAWARRGVGPDVAINHDREAIAMHTANHPSAKHYTENICKVNPRAVTKGRRVGLLWCSPDCRHFSRAKGGKPVVDIGMRMLAPRGLARAQGFPDSYILTGTKTSQVAKIGNSVSPCVAAAMVGANYAAKVWMA